MGATNTSYASPVQEFSPTSCAALAIPGSSAGDHTAISPTPQWIMATTNSNISFDFANANSVVLPFQAGVWVRMSPTAINYTSTTASSVFMMW